MPPIEFENLILILIEMVLKLFYFMELNYFNIILLFG